MSLAEILLPENRGPGLTTAELERAQEEAAAAFPPDLLEVLAECLPVGRGFPDWRNNAAKEMSEWRARLLEGFVFDVEQNGSWPGAWDAKPEDPREARARVAEIVDDAPRLIPIYAHRGIPNEPLEAGNPVFSVHQTDVVVYGHDLEQYLRHEFFNARGREGAPREIRFWTGALLWD
jgi:hypothetical protein